MGRHCLWVALIVWLVVSFVPMLSAANLLGAVTGRGKAKG